MRSRQIQQLWQATPLFSTRSVRAMPAVADLLLDCQARQIGCGKHACNTEQPRRTEPGFQESGKTSFVTVSFVTVKGA